MLACLLARCTRPLHTPFPASAVTHRTCALSAVPLQLCAPLSFSSWCWNARMGGWWPCVLAPNSTAQPASQPQRVGMHGTPPYALLSFPSCRAEQPLLGVFYFGLRTNLLMTPTLHKECCGPTAKRLHLCLSTTPLVSPQHVLHCVSVLRGWLVFAWGSALLHFALDALRTNIKRECQPLSSRNVSILIAS
jgi:hypothetical protein